MAQHRCSMHATTAGETGDLIRSFDLLLDDLNLLFRVGFAFLQRPLDGERRIVYDGEWILDLMRNLRRQPASRAQLALANGKLLCFLQP